jgi:hypothetical protein
MVTKITTAAAKPLRVLIQSIMQALDTSKCEPSRQLPIRKVTTPVPVAGARVAHSR